MKRISFLVVFLTLWFTSYQQSLFPVGVPIEGYASVVDSSYTLTATGGGSFDWITNGANTLWNNEYATGLTVQGDSMIVKLAGAYLIKYDLSYSAGNSSIYETGVLINGTINTTGGKCERGMSGTDAGVVSGRILITLSANDVVKLGIAESAGTTDPTILQGNWVIKKL